MQTSPLHIQSIPDRIHVFLAAAAFLLIGSLAAEPSAWIPVPESELPAARGLPSIRPDKSPRFLLDTDLLRAQLADASPEAVPGAPQTKAQLCRVALPLPDGTFADFAVFDAPVMAPELAARFPDIRTYRIVDINDPACTGRIDLTPKGFHAQFHRPPEHPGESAQFFIDPVFHLENGYHTVYHRQDLDPLDIRPEDSLKCQCPGCLDQPDALPPNTLPPNANPPPANGDTLTRSARGGGGRGFGSQLRTFRLALSATGEYTQFHGGTVADGMAAIVTGVNRLNEVYERDLAVRLQLVDNNDQIVFTDPRTDPFVAQNGSENQAVINRIIGTANYDIGHNLQISNGGLAGIGVICSFQKADGYSGDSRPIGDPFWIDFVAHEIGHQFGALHTFNSSLGGNCGGGNRDGESAYEPGSGSTIMGYANLCGSDNLQQSSDAYFHARSIEEIQATITSFGGCAVSTPTGNDVPVVDAGSSHFIPASTPFELTANAVDANTGDTLTYCWEQYNLGPASSLNAPDNGSSPLFRSFLPTTSPTRIFPRLADILANRSNGAEILPTANRTLIFRCTVRDKQTGTGGTNCDDRSLGVVASAGPFRLTFANAPINVSGATDVTWDVAGTTASPINCSAVDLFLSLDGGQTFPIQLADNLANNGSASILFPQQTTPNARLKIKAADNVFFDINDANFSIQPGSGAASFALAENDTIQIDDTTGTGNNNQVADPGENNLQLTITLQNVGTIPANNISATLSTTEPLAAIARSTTTYPNLQPNAASPNQSLFTLSLDPTFPCGTDLPLLLTVTSDQGNSTLPLTLRTGGNNTTPSTFQYNGPPIPIPDNNLTGAAVSIPVNLDATIRDLNVTIGGTTCSGTGNGINHTYIGDLTITLTSPGGTTVTLFDQPIGNGSGAEGPNLCNVVFDDQSGGIPFSSITQSGGPYTGTYTPDQALTAFTGQSASGTWVFRVSDGFPQDNGDIRDLRLTITPATTCDPPASNNGDSDNDGLPDNWETTTFTNLDQGPDDDPDNDRVTNLSEYIAGTDAANPAAFLRLLAAPDNQIAYQFQSRDDRFYALERLNDLEGAWQQIGNVFKGSGTLTTIPSQGPEPIAFYRIRVQLTE